jgi:hypothetical protein
MRRTAIAAFGLALICTTGRAFAEQSPPPPQAEPLTGILERIRQDVGYYEVQAARWRTDIPTPTGQNKPPAQLQSNTDPATSVCNADDFDFDVTNVETSLQTVLVKTGAGSVGLQVPLIGKEGSLDADASRQTSQTETISLTRRFRYDTDQLKRYQESEDYRGLEAAHEQYHTQTALAAGHANAVLPIAEALIELRNNLIRSAGKLPCFEWADKDVKPESSSVTLTFLVQQAANANVGFNFWIVSAHADAKLEHTNANTLTVSFAPHTIAVPHSQSIAQQPGRTPG